MDRIALNDNCKQILKAIKAGTYDVSIPREDTEDVNVLPSCQSYVEESFYLGR